MKMKNTYLDINPIPESLLDEIETNHSDKAELNPEYRKPARCGTGIGIDLSHLKPLSVESRGMLSSALGCLGTTNRDKT